MTIHKLILVRHGESEWTKNNLFCGWFDAKLSEKGLAEASYCGQAIRDAGFCFDVVYTSQLTRAHQTLQIILDEIGQKSVLIEKSWRLNERHYGALTGYNKEEMAAVYGLKQVQIWRRSFDILPPPMESDHKYHLQIRNNPNFSNGPNELEFPKAESLKTTMERVIPFWTEVIAPQIRAGKRVMICTHGTTLRGLVKHLDNMSDEAIMKLNLPTGIPFYYELDSDLKPLVSMKFLSDDETVRKAMEKVASISNKA